VGAAHTNQSHLAELSGVDGLCNVGEQEVAQRLSR
jgi:hypothetical protein